MTEPAPEAPLQVLQVNHSDTAGGGATVAGYRLHRALLEAGVRSSLLVGEKASPDPAVAELRRLRKLRAPIRAVTRRVGLDELDGVSAYGMHRRTEFAAANVVHFHALQGSYFSYPAMTRLTQAKPSVMTLHDMWALTGHCSFSFECERWRTGCGSCPHPEVFPRIERDATALEWKIKDRVWGASQLVVISPSRWLAEVARASMLGRFQIEHIPHGIDTEVFAPVDVAAARAALRLPVDRRIIMFAAASVSDHRKGADLVVSALQLMPATWRQEATVILMGNSCDEMKAWLGADGWDVVPFGYVGHDGLKALLYSAADVFVFPTRADNSPLVVLEALACGTPVATFDVGGVAEMVQEGVSGTLAPPEDVAALAECLAALLGDEARSRTLGAGARALIEAEYSNPLAARRHIELYKRVLSQAASTRVAP